MTDETKTLKAHLFICTNAPNLEGKCGHKNSENLRQALKKKCKNETWSDEVRINSAGCLGHCEEGITAVLYPQGQWFTDLTENDVEVLYQAVKKNIEA